MTDSIRVPFGGRILVKLIEKQEQNRVSAGGVALPDTAENTQDCEGIVLAVSNGPGYELPTWVAARIIRRGTSEDFIERKPRLYAEEVADLQELCAQPREPRVAAGDRILFDISLATQGPDAVDEYLIEGDAVYALVTPGPKVELLSTPHDPAGYALK